jgi:uncharacterized protein
MIAVADLAKGSYLPGNYFAPDVYVQGDFESGLIENRQGARLVALPEVLLKAIQITLERETGQAVGVVLYNCGRWWGKNFYRRFTEEVNGYYSRPLAEMSMAELMQCMKQCWKAHGWGILDLDIQHYVNGFLVVKVWNSPFAAAIEQSGKKPLCWTEAGILSAFFSQLTGQELHCAQTSCESLGADCNHFVIGLKERIQPVETLLEEGYSHDTIMERLAHTQPSKR